MLQFNRALLLIIFILTFLQSCSGDNSSSNSNDETQISFSQLNNSRYILTVNRELEQNNAFSFELTENDYVATENNVQYEVIFSENTQIVSIECDTKVCDGVNVRDISTSGFLQNSHDLIKIYYLSQLFAGGRFVVWIVDNHFEAELTTYGSGVPITSSERGILKLTQ